MGNLIAAELFKLRKSKSFLIIVCVVIGLSVLTGIVFALLDIIIDTDMPELEGMFATDGGQMLLTSLPMSLGNIMWVLAAFTAIFISGDFESGCIRNPLSVGFSRVHFYLTKFLLIMISNFIFVILTVLFTTLPFVLINGWGETPDFGVFFSVLAVGYLITVAQATIFAGIAFLTRKLGAAIGIGIGYLIVDAIIVAVLGIAGAHLPDFLLSLANILPSAAGMRVSEIAMGVAAGNDLWIMIVISFISIIIWAAISILSLQKRDI